MSAVLPLSIIGIVVAFLVEALGLFPLVGVGSGSSEGEAAIDETYSVEAVHEAANLFSGAYTSIVDDLVSYQKDPDYRRAEARSQDMVAYARSLLPRFQDLEDRLQGKLEDLTAQAEKPAEGATK